MRARPFMLLLVLCTVVSCGKKSSGEFDERPPIPMAPVALPVQPAEEEPRSANQDVRVGEDLRNPRTQDEPGTDPSLSGRAPKAQTYTYVPAVSPRTLPGEKVSEIKPDRTAVPRTELTKETPPPGAPLSVPPPPPSGPAPSVQNP